MSSITESLKRAEALIARLQEGRPHEWEAVPGPVPAGYARYRCPRCGSVLVTGHKPVPRDWRADPCDEAAVREVMDS
jgi:hypothetical protein